MTLAEEQERQSLEERRAYVERINALELKYVELKASIEKVVSEQTHVRELFGLRFTGVEATLSAIARNLDTISGQVRETADVAKIVKDNAEDVKKLTTEKDQLRGVLGLVQWMGVAGLIAMAAGLWKVFSLKL